MPYVSKVLLLVEVVLLILLLPAQGQDSSGAFTIVKDGKSEAEKFDKTARQCVATSAKELLQRTFAFSDTTTRDFPYEIPVESYRPEDYINKFSNAVGGKSYLTSVRQAPESGPVILKLNRIKSITDDDWQKSYIWCCSYG